MKYSLVCYPDLTYPNNLSLTVEILCLPGAGLQLHYCLQGSLQHLRIPEKQAPGRLDGLWEHTCFEAFIAVQDDNGYQEFNFSPSGQWASYLFSDYRHLREWQSDPIYAIEVEQSDTELLVKVVIPFSELPLTNNSKSIQIGLTAVLEATDSSKSYWALHHPANVPDFHHRGGFIYSLAPHLLSA